MAIGQIARARAGQAPETPRPVVALDSAHEVGQLAQPHLDADLVVRLAKNRVFRRAPQPYADRGRPHKHGPVFELQDASTHGPPDRSASLEHPVYGTVMVDAWTRLHVENAPTAPCSVVRVQVEHLPHLGQPMPLWLAWMGGPLPDDLHLVWRWYLRRFSVEHAFRFAKQQLGWTTVRLRSPVAADRWTWLVRRVATLNPFCRKERFGITTSGSTAYPRAKTQRDRSMPSKRDISEGVWGTVPHDPRARVKAGLPEPQSPRVLFTLLDDNTSMARPLGHVEANQST